MNVLGINWNVEFVTTLSFDAFKVEFAEQHFTDLEPKEQEEKFKQVYTLIYKEAGKEAVVSTHKPNRKEKEEGAQ